MLVSLIHASPISFPCAIALGRCSASLSLSRLWVRGYVKESDLHRFNTNSIYFFRLNTTKKIEKRYIKYVSIIYNRIVMRKSRRNNRLVKIIKNVLVGQVLYTIYPYVVVSLIFFYADPFSISILASYRSRKTSSSEV